ncbi:sigma-70 family RNA polymerase sigma factor [Naasia sp. SYSU D00057]|uniref:sigma-70 family RNA polymerase sigma factor n=1 Tax=Naasia sp. SYSU D00057 TaxID=2817380 RepID=UPI001B305AB9|nr:sigma-70 family RNA polymerase sigma factor [Naasia sp. SYSU D00057]
MEQTVGGVVEEAARYRRELTAHCYRMLGSSAEAEDAVQETMLRAWQGERGFEGRASLKSWLYRIATNVCIDMTRSAQRRALPMDLTGPGAVTEVTDIGSPMESTRWIEPVPDGKVLPDSADPADIAVQRETVRLAFVTALAHLPAQQRAVLLLREVLQWSAAETAELLGVSVDAVTSSLARARSTMRQREATQPGRPLDDGDRTLLDDYVSAFEAYDVQALVGLLQQDAAFTMPPFAFWLRGADQIEQWWNGPGTVCRGSKVLPTRANGGPAVAVYHPVSADRWEPFAIHLLEVRDGRIAAIHHFLDTTLFGAFGLPDALSA